MLSTYQVTHQITEALPESTWSEICRRLRTEPAMLSVCQHPGVLDSLLGYSDFDDLSNWKPGVVGLRAISDLVPESAPDSYNWLTETLAGRERLHNAYAALFAGKVISPSGTNTDALVVATEAAVALRQELAQKDGRLRRIIKEASSNPDIWRLPLTCLYGLVETDEPLIEELLISEPFTLAQVVVHIWEANETPKTQRSLVEVSAENLPPKARLCLAVALKKSSDPELHKLVGNNLPESPEYIQEDAEELSTFSASIAEHTIDSLLAIETESEHALDKLAMTLQASQSLTNKLAIRLGKAALDKGDPVSALAAFEQAKDFGGDLIELAIYTAEAKVALGMPGDALEVLSHIEHKSPRSQLALARAYYANGDIALASETAAGVIDSTDTPSELSGLADILGSAGAHEDASLALEKAIPISKSPANLLVLQSQHLLASGRIQDARQTAFEAVALETQSAQHRIVLAEALAYKDTVIPPNYVEALVHWEKALKLKPNDPHIQLQFTRCALESGKPDEARDQCNKLLSYNEIDANASKHERAIVGEAHTLLAQALLQLGETELGSQHFQKATQIAPQSPEPWRAIASFHKIRGEYDRAYSALKSGHDNINGEDSSSKGLLLGDIGELQLTMQDNHTAVESLKEASILRPTDGHIHHQYGKALIAQNNWSEAINALTRASEITPTEATVWHDLGTAYQEIGNTTSALKSLQRAQASGLRSRDLSKRTGELALALQEYELARVSLQPLVDDQTNDVEILSTYGNVLENTLDWQNALRMYQRAIEITPDDKSLLAKIGNCCLALNDSKAAIATLVPAAAKHTTDLELQKAASKAYMHSEMWSDALPYLERVISLAPDDTISIKETALVSSKAGHQQQAIELLHRASALDPDDASIHSDLSKLYQQSERWAEAQSALEKAITLEPHNAKLQKQLANCLSALGDEKTALEVLNRAITIDPDDLGVLETLGESQFKSKQYQHAHDTFLRAVDLSKNDENSNGSSRASYLARAGDTLIAQKQKAKATALWQKALLEEPDNATLQKKLGEVLMVQDRYEEASTAFESAIEVDAENTNAVLGAAEAAMAIGEQNRAQRHLKNIGTDCFESADTSYRAGLLHFQLHNYDAALSAFKISLDLVPEKGIYRAMLARVLSLTANSSTAASEAEKALAHAPTDIDVLTNAGIVLLQSERRKSAIKYLTRVADSIDADSDTLISIATELVRSQERRRLYERNDLRSDEERRLVASTLQRAAKLGTNAMVIQEWLARAQSLVGDMDTAIPALELAASQTESAEIYCALAASYLSTGKLDKAEQAARWVLDRYPDNTNALLEISNIYSIRKDHDGQTQSVERAISIEPNDAIAQYMLGKVHIVLGNIEEARTAIARALQIEPEHSSWHFQLGTLCRELDESAAALSHFQKAVQLSSEQQLEENIVINYQIELARAYSSDGDNAAAREQYDAALKHGGTETELLIEAGRVCMQQGDVSAAMERFEKAANLCPGDIEPIVGVLKAAMLLGEKDKSEAYALKVLKQNPDNSTALTILAELYAAQGDTNNAIVSIDHAIENTNDPGPVILEKARLLSNASKHDQALSVLESDIEAFSENHDAWELLGDLYEQSGDIEASINAFTKAIKLAPLHFHCHLRIADLCIKHNELDKAMLHLDNAVKLQSDDDDSGKLQATLGNLFVARKQFDRAYKAYSISIKLAPTNANLYFKAGLALKQLKDYSEAMLMFKKSVEIDPNNVSAHRQLAAVSALGLISGDATT